MTNIDIKPLIDRCRQLAPGTEMPIAKLIQDAGYSLEDRALYKTVADTLAALPTSVGVYKIGRKGHVSRFIRSGTPTDSASHSEEVPPSSPPRSASPPSTSSVSRRVPATRAAFGEEESTPSDADNEGHTTTEQDSDTNDAIVTRAESHAVTMEPIRSTLSTITNRVEELSRMAGFIVMTAQLRPGMYIPFGLPKDVTQQEIDRLVVFLQNLHPSYRDVPVNAEVSTSLHDAHGKPILPVL